MKISHVLFSVALLTAIGVKGQVPATKDIGTPQTEIGIVEHLDEYLPDDLTFIGTDDQPYNLKQLINKPTVLMFVYYRCPGICSPLMNSMAEIIDKTDLVLGKDYQVITISFDQREGTEVALKKRNNYLNQITKEVDKDGWKFYTGDSANIAKATNAVGFKFKKAGNDFLHSATIIMLSPDGKITRYLQGTYFLPFEFKMAVVEASKGKSGPTIFRILQFCYSYDPAGQQYVLNITKMAGTLILGLGFIVFLILVFKPRKKITSNKE
ncbi:MAG: SCO family protein [Bacteroidetes bacterium HGW-Bacteroidetes-9]|jgi:protein SCO1/2|nr:MAG: SCO family protein [Bacteroidetes bacterium HGW-Bacteroidetes-9]